MTWKTEDLLLRIVMYVIIVVVALMAFVYLPVFLYTDAMCLRMGYPKSDVSIGLEKYCITLDGDVTVNVDKLVK